MAADKNVAQQHGLFLYSLDIFLAFRVRQVTFQNLSIRDGGNTCWSFLATERPNLVFLGTSIRSNDFHFLLASSTIEKLTSYDVTVRRLYVIKIIFILIVKSPD